MINININKNSNQSGRKERMECSADTKLFFDDVYKSGTRGKKQQVDVLQYGRSMIEMLGVLAIVGVLSVGGIAGYSKAMEKFKINKTIDQISHIIANVQTLYAQQTTYAGLDSDSNGDLYIGNDITKNGYKYINPFNGTYFVESAYVMGNDDQMFSVYVSNLPKEACITLLTQDWGAATSNSIVGITVTNYGNPTQATPTTIIDSKCNTGTDSEDTFICNPDFPVTVVKATKYCKYDQHQLQIAIKK